MGDYVVVASQINRVDGDGNLLEPLRRGDTFAASDVSEAELKRWEEMTPRVVQSKKELEEARKAHADAASTIEDLQQQLAEARGELAAARASSPQLEREASTTAPTEPSGNASRDEWAQYAVAVDGENAAWINDTDNVSRNDIRDKYRS
jgi:chromosome segregation ATPase